MLTLAAAIKENRLADFVREQEKSGHGPIKLKEFDGATTTVVRAPQSLNQTSGSPSPDNSSGKKTR